MEIPPTPIRRLANNLVGCAALLMPGALRQWAQAMRNEMAYVASDREAVRWAIGCLGAAFATRMRGLCLLDVRAVRTAGVMLALFCAFDVTLPTAMTVAYRLGALGVTKDLGRTTPGDDYGRLVPLMEAIPAWLHVLLLAAGACYIAAVVCLLGRRRAAYGALLLGVGLGLATRLLSRPILAATGVTVAPDPSFVAAVLLPVVLPLLLAFAAWSGSRRDSNRLRTG